MIRYGWDWVQHNAPGMTQNEVADHLRVAGSTVSRWRNGRGSMSPEVMVRLARKLGRPGLEGLVAGGYLPGETLEVMQKEAVAALQADITGDATMLAAYSGAQVVEEILRRNLSEDAALLSAFSDVQLLAEVRRRMEDR